MHTPGPWVDCGGAICRVEGSVEDCNFVEVVSRPINNADAALIAAAPDLLAALHTARPWIVTDRNTYAEMVRAREIACGKADADSAVILSGYDAALDEIDAAIAKAEGRS